MPEHDGDRAAPRRRWFPSVVLCAAAFGLAALFLPVPTWIKVFVVAQAIVLAALGHVQREAAPLLPSSSLRSEDRDQLMWATLTRECRRATRLGTAVSVFAIELGVAPAEDAVRALSPRIRETDLVVVGPGSHTVLASLVVPDARAAPSTLHRISTMLADVDIGVARSGIAVFPHDHATPTELVNLALERMAATPTDETTRSPVDDLAEPPPNMSTRSRTSRSVGRALWRAFEFSVASAALVLSAPVIAVAAIAVRMHDRGPAFFVQKRSGLDGVPFDLYKLRSMSVGAESRLDEVADLNEIEGTFKSSNDPRVTRIGRFLRRSSIDELPQLWNVVRGDMALVGPRPSSNLAAKHLPWELERLTTKPGITGLWQVRHRGQLSFNDRARLDIQYARERSSWLDLKILAQTIPAVLTTRGRH